MALEIEQIAIKTFSSNVLDNLAKQINEWLRGIYEDSGWRIELIDTNVNHFKDADEPYNVIVTYKRIA